MTTLVLGTLGSTISPVGGFLGAQIGQRIDNLIFGANRLAGIEGPRLSDLTVQTSTYGKMIPVVYGTVRTAGNIIWSRPLKEIAERTTYTSGGGKGGSRTVEQSETQYSYYATLAIAICEGPIDEVVRMWADALPVNPEQISVSYTLYKGDEDQLPDPVIESFEGVGEVPAYRGLAYIVIEDFPLADFGNRIPNFSFEIRKKALGVFSAGEPVENLIESMIMIPGSGEFVYDTTIQRKKSGEISDGDFVTQGNVRDINMNNASSKADALVALDQLQESCPNVEWIGLVVTWFGTSVDAGDCVILPGVEYQTGATTEPEIWSSAGFTRTTAHQITLIEGNPVYGGTPDDQCVVRYVDELRARGYKVMFYPLFFMDVENKPWRGRVTGTPTEVVDFFTKTNGYNAYVNHYANLLQGKVDGFVIGSEMIGLTKVKDGSNNFPAVSALISLAASVRGILGSGVKLTYAADWSEYHHTDGGWYNLDPLWASSNIDFIGIDAYFPLTNEPQDGYDIQKIMDGWTSGEGYDYYYSDPERTIQVPLDPEYAWKNMAWWWSNTHVNPDLTTTPWTPESKKIWFTEYGFPSLDGATNQPNVFYDPNSSESAFPRFSQGIVDLRAQRAGLEATERKWAGSAIIERRFVWTWDARPFPFWPDLEDVWADGDLWAFGHWVNGKLGVSNLAAIVASLLDKAGIPSNRYDVSELTDIVDGFILTTQQTYREAIESLQTAYFFDVVESEGVLRFLKRGRETSLAVTADQLVPTETDSGLQTLTIKRTQELELYQKVDVNFIHRSFNYQVGNQHSERSVTQSQEKLTLNLPIVMNEQLAKAVADVTLYNAWQSRQVYECELPYSEIALDPADILEVTKDGITHIIRITQIQTGKPGILKIKGVSEESAVYDFSSQTDSIAAQTQPIPDPGTTTLTLLDLPAFPTDGQEDTPLRIAATGANSVWAGAVIYRSDDGGAEYKVLTQVSAAAILGTALNPLADASGNITDWKDTLTVLLQSGELQSISELAMLNGGNAALVGNEIIQFREATLLAPYKYQLSGLLRGRLGTEQCAATHAYNERFIMLDNRVVSTNLARNLLGQSRSYKPVTLGKTLAGTTAVDFLYTGQSLKPYSPVHVSAERDGAQNITFHWIRRTRIDGEWRDGVDVALAEAQEAYEVDVLSGSLVVRTIAGLSSPQASYSAADQTADFGSPQSSVTIRVYQLSSSVGRGTPAEVTV